MSTLGKIIKKAGGTLDDAADAVLDEIERSPKNAKKIISEIGRSAGLFGRRGVDEMWGPARRAPGLTIPTRPVVPPQYQIPAQFEDMLDALDEGDMAPCQSAGAKPWTITSTVLIAAAALAADTDLGATTNPFAAANSAFFTTAGVFPQPFLAHSIGGTITATQPAAATETPAALDSLYMSMRATTELARMGLTGDLGFQIALQGNVAAAAGTGAAIIEAPRYVPWRQYFDPKTTYVWGARLPRATTTVGAVAYTIRLRGFLFEGGSIGRGRR